MKRTILLLALGILCPALSSQAFAQPYPNKPIRMIVPFSPGGATDIVARIYAQALQTRVGQSVIVENRVGGNGIIGTDAVARAPADGYTLLFSYPGAITVNPALYEKLSYDPVKDFLPVALLVKYSFILSVNPNVPAKDRQGIYRSGEGTAGETALWQCGNRFDGTFDDGAFPSRCGRRHHTCSVQGIEPDRH
jgi:tripartite-type tricarboxylate transporter receptor subunit TctC